MNINFDSAGRQPKGPVAQVLTAIVGVLFLAGALMFSLVFFAVIAVAGLVLWLWFWWKTRALRQAIREAQIAAQASGQAESRRRSASEHAEPRAEDIIEGEFVRETTASQTAKLNESLPNRIERD